MSRLTLWFNAALGLALCLGGFLSLVAVPAEGNPGDPGAGGVLYANHCASCHGPNPAQPKMVDPYASADNEVLKGAITSFLVELKANPPHPDMVGVLDPLTSTDLGNLAAYLASEDPNTYSVAGTLKVQGNPAVKIANATISVMQGSSTKGMTNTDASGTYMVSGLQAGEYTVKPSHPDWDFVPLSTTVQFSVAGVRKAYESLTSGTSLTGVNFAGKSHGPSITLYVNRCANCHGSDPSSNQNDILEGARKSILQQLAGMPTHGGQKPFTEPTPLTENHYKDLAAFLASKDSNLYSISGTVMDSAGVSNVWIAVDSDYNPGKTGKTVAGAYQVAGLRAGDYTATPSHVAYSFQPAAHTVGLSRSGVVLAGSAPQANTTNLQDVNFQGQLLPYFGDGKAIYDAKCATCHGSDPSQDKDHILYGAAPFVLESFAFGSAQAPQGMLDAFVGLTQDDLNKLAAYLSAMGPPYIIEGRVKLSYLDPTKQLTNPPGAIPDATVTVSSTTFPEVKTATTDSKGIYSIGGLLAGEKTVTVSKFGFTFFAKSSQKKVLHPFLWPSLAQKTPNGLLVPNVDFVGAFDGTLSQAGGGIYGAHCSSCHGSDPTQNKDNILLGARLSVLRTLQAQAPQGQLYPEPPSWTPVYGLAQHEPAPFASLTQDELQQLAAYLSSEDWRQYKISGTLKPATADVDVDGIVVSIFSETSPGGVAQADAQGKYTVGGLQAGDYLVTPLSESVVIPSERQVFMTFDLMGIVNVLSIPAKEFVPLHLFGVDFTIGTPAIIHPIVYEILQEVLKGYERGDAGAMSRQLCPDFRDRQEGVRGRGASELTRSVRGDSRNLSGIDVEVQIGRPRRGASRGEIEVPLTWQRRARLRSTRQEWLVHGQRTRMVLRQEGSRLLVCSLEGARLLGLTDAFGRLVIKEGTLDGRPVRQPVAVEHGSPVRAPGSRPGVAVPTPARPGRAVGTDLAVVEIETSPASPRLGQPFTVYATVKNQGTERSSEASARLRLGATILPDKAVGPLAPGRSSRLSWRVTARRAGANRLEVSVEPGARSGDANPGNNTLTRTVEVTGGGRESVRPQSDTR